MATRWQKQRCSDVGPTCEERYQREVRCAVLRIAKTLSAQVQWFPSGPVGERYASLASAGFADFARPWMNSERTGSETGPKSWREQSSFILSSRAEDTASLSHWLLTSRVVLEMHTAVLGQHSSEQRRLSARESS